MKSYDNFVSDFQVPKLLDGFKSIVVCRCKATYLSSTERSEEISPNCPLYNWPTTFASFHARTVADNLTNHRDT